MFFTTVLRVGAQEFKRNTNYFVAAIGFWNVENLYDTLNDQWKNDEDFTPVGAYAWTGIRYRQKIQNLSFAISQIAKETSPDGLALLGLCEIENRMVLEDLVNSPDLKLRNYQIVHLEGPDARGIDPAFLYNPKYFQLQKAKSYPVKMVIDSTYKTRDILLVSGVFLGEPLSILINHWPSRRGGELSSRPNRNKAAQLARALVDSLQGSDSTLKIIVMGDFNDDPVNESVRKNLQTTGSIQKVNRSVLLNPMEKLYKEGIGSLAWKDNWNLFDQIIFNQQLCATDFKNWQFYSAHVFNKSFLRSDLPADKGYPFRTFFGPKYLGGYSDHFPVYILIAKEKTN